MRRGLLLPLLLLAAAGVVALIAITGASAESTYSWSKSKQRPPLVRTEVAGAAVGGDLYVIGGFVPPRRTTAAVERLRNGRWSRVRPLPVPLNHAAAVGYRGYLYVGGGYAGRDGLTDAVRTLYRYDPKHNRWSRLPDMPTARAALAAGAADGRLFAAGGAAEGRQTGVLEIYDIAKRRWSRGPSLSVAREHLGGLIHAGRFYAVAGRNNQSGNLAIVEGYDPARRRWSRLPDMPKERGGNGAAQLGAGIVAVGGEEGAGTIGEVDRFDFETRRWQRLTPMPTPRHGLAVIADARHRVVAVSGGPQPGMAFSNAVEVLAAR
jgi:hypothetical protein